MCGICGIVLGNNDTPALTLLQEMARTMRHRGPDDEGYHQEPGLGVGFQRLSIIDLQGGHQPMANEEGTLTIVFNGEIYNYQILREKLEATGRHRFSTKSDTEVILHLYQEHGVDCVHHLRGMFAFAIWDRDKRSLFMARDRFGKKPFVYAELPGGFLFASEIKALMKHPAIRKEINYPAIDLYLSYQYIPSPHTIFSQIKKLPPACRALWREGRLAIERYWEPAFLPKTTLSLEDASLQMLAILRESTRLRMIADVPLGAFLSGGKDSSLVVGLMSELSSRPVKTFTIGFEEESFSELPYARQVARHFHSDHHEFVVKPDTVEMLPKLAWFYGEPYADPSALPSFYVSQMTRQHVTVALNGDGGDENFAGYPRYQAMALLQGLNVLPRSWRLAVSRLADRLPDRLPPYRLYWRAKRLLHAGLADPRTVYTDTLCFFREDEKPLLYSAFLKEHIGRQFAPDYVRQILAQCMNLQGVDPFLYTDMHSYLPECLMVKMDIASMANSLETRSPMLDHEFVECVARFPPEWKLSRTLTSKYILGRAIRGLLPREIVTRGKQGFSLPLSLWFRGKLNSYIRATLLSERALARDLFQKEALTRIIDETTSGARDRSHGIWALLMLEHWFQVYMD